MAGAGKKRGKSIACVDPTSLVSKGRIRHGVPRKTAARLPRRVHVPRRKTRSIAANKRPQAGQVHTGPHDRVRFAGLHREAFQRKGHSRQRHRHNYQKGPGHFRTIWRWGMMTDRLTGSFPNRGLRYPKASEKPPFQTWAEFSRQIQRGGLSDAEQSELWDCLYLTLPEVDELLRLVKKQDLRRVTST